MTRTFKRVSALLMAGWLALIPSCGKKEPLPEPSISQMQAICHLSVMDCYYHNVAKFRQEDAAGALWWKQDKHFWIEYEGVVTLGIDVSRVKINLHDNQVEITIPPAEVQKCRVNEETLTPDSFIVAKDSAKITAEDERFAFERAQADMEAAAAGDRALLAQAQQRAQQLLEDYIRNFETLTGEHYEIVWEYLEDTVSEPAGEVSSEPAS